MQAKVWLSRASSIGKGTPHLMLLLKHKKDTTLKSLNKSMLPYTCWLAMFSLTKQIRYQINVTLLNSPDSATLVNIANITIAYGNTTDVINGTLSNPALPYPLDVNAASRSTVLGTGPTKATAT